jgi:thymidylate kinase
MGLLEAAIGHRYAGKICESIAKDDWDSIAPIRRSRLRILPVPSLLRMFHEGMWRIKRISIRKGLFVVLLGVDGVGKTTVADHLKVLLEGYFPAVHVSQGPRPCFLLSGSKGRSLTKWLGKNPTEKVSAGELSPSYPRGNKVNLQKGSGNAIIDLFKLLFYFVDTWMGYLFKINITRFNGGIYLMVRYFYCEIAYGRDRWHLPAFVLQIVGKMLPRPDLTILLYDDPEIIHSRKDELSVEKIAEYQLRYELLGKKIKYFHKIRTSENAENIAGQIKQIILERFAHE